MKEFNKLQDLAYWLDNIGVDVSQWTANASKTIENLWDEYVNEDVSFQDDPPLRIVQVVQVIASHQDKILFEVEQEFTTGKRRSRKQPPSEKIKAGEKLHDAALRCLHEEVGLDPTQVRFIESNYEKEQETKESPSYPGLMTQYTVHTLEAEVTGLPTQRFWRLNWAAEEGDPVKRHLWDWI